VALITFIALLRGVNVGGNRKVAMADLRAMLAALGFEDPRSLLQSGNLIFRALGDAHAIEAELEREMRSRLGLATDVIVRSAADWASVIAGNPFPADAARDPAHLLVMSLKGEPDAAAFASLQVAISGRERAAARSRELYIVYPERIGRSKLTGALIERKLGLRGTARNWNTALKLAELAAA
jgi:uncharacterized protein (DUF1697 family)